MVGYRLVKSDAASKSVKRGSPRTGIKERVYFQELQNVDFS